MDEPTRTLGPDDLKGDPSAHLPWERVLEGWQALAKPHPDRGHVNLLVTRGIDGWRRRPAHCLLSKTTGTTGDRWVLGKADLNMQLAVMRTDVATLLANGQPLELFGDNLFVTLDISKTNLPIGTTVRVGDALCVVTHEPHLACSQFRERFGHAALKLTTIKDGRAHNLRGIYWSVLEDGMVQPGSSIEILHRPSST